MITIKTQEDIEKLRVCGKRLAFIIQETSKLLKPGVTTLELNEFAEKLMFENGDKPAFLNFRPRGAKRPYPAGMCISINDEVVHGIPNEDPQTLKEGDIITLDAGLTHKGLITDHAITYTIGEVDKDVKKLLNVTNEALYSGIKQARAGNRIGDISNAIEKQAIKNNLGIIEGLSGHGVGYEVHEDPYVPNYGKAGTGEVLEPGMVLAIEPMFSLGGSAIFLEKDGYTYKTKDGSLNAQFEHTVLITDGDPEILTKIK